VTRLRLRLLAVTLLALGAYPVLGVSAGEPGAAGWWSRTSTPLPVNPAAPTAGEDQLVVQGEPSGANAIAALRWTLAEGESSPTLTITAADGSMVPTEALILACRAGSPWEDTADGAWADAPKVDCGTSVNGVVADDGTITFALGTLLDGSDLDIVLTPGTTPEGRGSTFSLIFDRPGADALMTSDGGGDETAFDPVTAGGDFSTESSDSFSAPSTDAGSFTAPSGGTDSFAAAEPALPAENQVPPGSGDDQAASGGTGQAAMQQAASSSDRDRARTLGIAVLLAGAAAAAWSFMASAPAEVPRGGVPAPPVAASTVPGGLGRFVRPRTGPPPSLS
jgi:hypothetical protein